MRTISGIKDMVLHKGQKINDEEKYENMRKMMEENTDSGSPVILITTDGVAFYPSLSRYKLARHVRQFVKNSNVTFENIDIK